MAYKSIEEMLAENKGFLRTADVLDAGFSKDNLYQYIRKEGLEKAGHGIYVAPDAWPDELYLLQSQYPKAIYSHETALYLHNLAERAPTPPTVTVAANYNNVRLLEKGVTVAYIKKEWYELGICEAKTPYGHSIRVYDMERTICDIVRKRSDMEVAVFAYAVQQYARHKEKDLPKLMEYAERMHIQRKVRDIMEVLL